MKQPKKNKEKKENKTMNILKNGKLEVVIAEVKKIKAGEGKCSLLLKDKVYDPEQKTEVDRERWANAFNREGGYPTADNCAKLTQDTTAVFSLYVDGDKCYVNSVRRAGLLPLVIKKEGEADEKACVLIGVACNVQTGEVKKKDKSVTKVTYASIPIHIPPKGNGGSDEFDTEWHRVSFWNSENRPDFADKMAKLLKDKPRVAILASETKKDEWTNRNGALEVSYTHYGRLVELLPKAKEFKKEKESGVNVPKKPASAPKAEESPFEDYDNGNGSTMVGPVEDFLCTLSMKYQKKPTLFSEIVKDEKSKSWMTIVVKRMQEQVTDEPVEGTISTKEQLDRIARYIA